jgi:hypothetical protein
MPTETIQLPLTGGIDQKTSQHYLDPTQRLRLVTNGLPYKTGTIRKRVGMARASASTVASAARLSGWSKGDLTAFGTAGNVVEVIGSEIVASGNIPQPQAVRRPIVTTPTTTPPILCDFVGPTGTTWRMALYAGPNTAANHGTVYATVYDATTRTVLVPPTLVYTASGAYAAIPYAGLYLANAPTAEQVAIFIVDYTPAGGGSAFNFLYALNFVASTLTFTAATQLVGCPNVSSSVSHPVFDVCPWIGQPGGQFLVAWPGTNTGFAGALYNPNFTQVSTWTIVNTPGSGYISTGDGTGGTPSYNQIAIYGTYGASEFIWVEATFYRDGPAQQLAYICCFKGDGSFTSAFAPTTLGTATQWWITGPVRLTASTAWFGRTGAVGGGGNQYQSFQGTWYTFNSSGTTVAEGYMPLGTFPAARPFAVNGTPYLPSIFTLYSSYSLGSGATQSYQSTLFVMTTNTWGAFGLQGMVPVATIAPRQIDPQSQNYTIQTLLHVPFCSSVSGATYYALSVRTRGVDTPGSINPVALAPSTPTWEAGVNFASSLLYSSNELLSELHVAAATPMVLDGSQAFEDNFFYYPEFSYVSQTGSGNSQSGTVSYAIVYAYQDAAGLLHRSVPFFTPTFTLSGGAYPVANFPTYAMTYRDQISPGQVYAEIYRIQYNSAGTTYYLVDRVSCSGNPSGGYISYTDIATDTQISTATILYTTGMVLDQVCPPGTSIQWTHKNRNWIVDETYRGVWFTQQASAGLAPGYNEALYFAIPDGGDITGGIGMDAEMLIFKASSIWVVYGGDGPAITGQGNDLTMPQQIASDVGAVDWRSLVLTPLGVMFASASGIYLCDRSLNVTYIGAQVQDLFSSYPVVVGATIVPMWNQVRFACQNTAGTSSIILCYDYLLSQWLQYTYPFESAPIVSIDMSQSGVYSHLTSDGYVWQERPTTSTIAYFDDDIAGAQHFNPTSITLAELKAAGPGSPQGYQRMRWVQVYADLFDSCGLSIALTVNGTSTQVQGASWPSKYISNLPRAQVSMHVAGAYAKAESIGITVSDVAGSSMTTGQGADFINVACEIDVISDRFRQVPAQAKA